MIFIIENKLLNYFTSHKYITSSNENSRLKQINIHRKKKYILLELFSTRKKEIYLTKNTSFSPLIPK